MGVEHKERLSDHLKAIFYDFDGVIADSKDATITYFQETLRHFGFPIPDPSEFDNLLGLKTIDIMRGLLPNLSDDEIGPVFEYSRLKSVEYVPQIKLIIGADTVLKNLHPNYRQALITNRGKQTVSQLLDLFNLRQHFDMVIDRDDTTKHKPDPEGIITVMQRLNLIPKDVIYVGDTEEDIQAAMGAKIGCVLVGKDIASIGDLPNYITSCTP